MKPLNYEPKPFAKLKALFTIYMVNNEGDTKLPTSSTCFFFPKFLKKEILKDKLVLAIRSAKVSYLGKVKFLPNFAKFCKIYKIQNLALNKLLIKKII